MAELRGGAGLQKALAKIAEGLKNGATLRVGFLENAKYPDGTPVAMIGVIQDFGAPGAGIPPRPFFRNFISKNEDGWPSAMATLLVANDYDAEKTLNVMGAVLKGQLQQSIHDTNSPALAQSTIDRKGFTKTLIDSGHMLNSVDWEVTR